MNNEFSLSELYEVFIKTTLPIEINGKKYSAGETICIFDKIQIANFNEIKRYATAHGGFHDIDRVFWENTKEVDITFSQGIFNHLQFALLCNANMIYRKKDDVIRIPHREEQESDENGVIKFSKTPSESFFIYDKKTGEKIEQYTLIGEKEIKIEKPFLSVILDYVYNYVDGAQQVKIGERLIEGFLRLEGKTRVKDDISGKVRTGIIEIPKLKLMSDLSIRLGRNADPMTVNFNAIGVPVGGRGTSYVCNFIVLDEDIDF